MLLRHASAAALRGRQTALRRTQTSQPVRSRGAALASTAATTTQSSAWPAFLAPVVSKITDGAGLGELQRLKAAVNEAETAHEAAVQQRAEALRAHDSLTQGRSTTQADLTVLLQRRDAWDADDVKKFTRLTSDEHDLKTRISESLVARESSERAAEAACPVPLTVRGTQALVSFVPLAFKLFYAARQNAVLRRSSFPSP